MTHPTITPCGRGYVARRRVDGAVQYMGRDLAWVDSMGLPAECVVTATWPTLRKAWGGVIAEAYQREADEAQRLALAERIDLGAMLTAYVERQAISQGMTVIRTTGNLSKHFGF